MGRKYYSIQSSMGVLVCITSLSLWVCPSSAWVIYPPPASHGRRCSSWGWCRAPPSPSPPCPAPGTVSGWAQAVFQPVHLISPALLTECPETRTFNFKLSLKFMQSIKSLTMLMLSHSVGGIKSLKITWKPPDTGSVESFSGLFHFLMRLFVLFLLFAKLLRLSVPDSGRTTPVSYFRINRFVGLDFACKWDWEFIRRDRIKWNHIEKILWCHSHVICQGLTLPKLSINH